jgi:2-dehydropantoate 2-reductase
MSAACGLARAPFGAIRDAPYGMLLLERALGETAAVGRALGVALPEDEEEKALATFTTLPAGLKPSFLLDVESGGPTELDALSGAVSRLGRQAGVPTPVHDVATAALSVRRAGL